MAAQYIECQVPTIDVNGNVVNTASFVSAMESLDIQALTRQSGQYDYFKNGVFQGQANEFKWLIDSSNDTTALNNFNSFKNGVTWGTLVPHYEVLSMFGNG